MKRVSGSRTNLVYIQLRIFKAKWKKLQIGRYIIFSN